MNAGPIHLLERDYFLDLSHEKWPPKNLRALDDLSSKPPAGETQWEASNWSLETRDKDSPRFLHRTIERHYRPLHPEQCKLDETILRFPSCPLFGTQRKQDYQFQLKPINQHTFRLLRPTSAPAGERFQRVFIILNGLNEIDHLGFYYDLAGLLIQDNATACLVHPFPGHLTRYPMVGRYAEKPLNRFINDPSDLFRQYLRYMVEIQWLLSALVPISSYQVAPGISLLEASDGPRGGRCDAKILSEAIESAWSSIHQRSAELVGYPKGSRGEIVHAKGVLDSIEAMRELLGWQPSEGPLTSYPKDAPLPPPALHIIGYSLGGYLAQSAFFTWPFAISSCTTLCSGGALNDLRPVQFAHEEEWRAVMHGLKYELDSGMLERRIRTDPSGKSSDAETQETVVGIPADYFSSHFRMFNEVFLQDSHGSYRSRVSEFSPRLLFVVGGNDPIVTTRSVIEASPDEGINMIEIAKLGHFVATSSGEWRNFWLPAISTLLFAFANRAAILLSRATLDNLWNSERTGPANGNKWPIANSSDVTTPRRASYDRQTEALDSEGFQRELTRMVESLIHSNGILLILRNQIPTALMGSRLLHKRGTVPHYEDSRIREYWHGLSERRTLMLRHHKRLMLVVPAKLRTWFVRRPPILSVKSGPSIRSIPTIPGLKSIWNEFLDIWGGTGSLFCFHPETPREMPDDPRFRLERMVRKRTHTEEPHPILNCLPDVWIAFSGKAMARILGLQKLSMHSCFLEFVSNVYEETVEKGLSPNKTSMEKWLATGDLRLIRVSGADSSPRFLGERVWDSERALDLLVHSALALARSTQCLSRQDFGGPEIPQETSVSDE